MWSPQFHIPTKYEILLKRMLTFFGFKGQISSSDTASIPILHKVLWGNPNKKERETLSKRERGQSAFVFNGKIRVTGSRSLLKLKKWLNKTRRSASIRTIDLT